MKLETVTRHNFSCNTKFQIDVHRLITLSVTSTAALWFPYSVQPRGFTPLLHNAAQHASSSPDVCSFSGKEKRSSACLRELVPTRVHVRSRPPLCACNSAKEFWTHVRSFHVLWGCRPRACSQHELKAQQGHLSLDSTPIVLSFLPAVFQRETLKRCEGRRKEQGGGTAFYLLPQLAATSIMTGADNWQ